MCRPEPGSESWGQRIPVRKIIRHDVGAIHGSGTYGVNDPGSTVPGWGVDGGPKIEEEDSGNTATVKVVCGVIFRRNHIDISTDDPHADGAGDTTDEKKFPATELIDKEKQPDKRHNGLDHTEDASHQIDSVGLDTNALYM